MKCITLLREKRISILEKFINRYPNVAGDNKNIMELAITYSEYGKKELFQDTLLFLIKKYPHDIHGRTTLSRSYIENKDYDKAKNLIEQAFLISKETNQDDIYIQSLALRLALESFDFEWINTFFKKSSTSKINFDKINNSSILTKNLVDIIRDTQSETLLNQIKTLISEAEILENVFIFNEIGIAYRKLAIQNKIKFYDYIKKAFTYFQDAQTIDSQNVVAYTEMGRTLKLMGEYNYALAQFKQGMKLPKGKENPHIRTEYAKLLYENYAHLTNNDNKIWTKEEAFNEAEKILLGTLELNGFHYHSRSELGLLYQQKQEYHKGIEILLPATQKFSLESVPALVVLGRTYAIIGEYTKAESVLTSAIELNIWDIAPKHTLLSLFIKINNLEKIENLWDTLVSQVENLSSVERKISEGLAQFCNTYVTYLISQKKWEKANMVLNRGRSLNMNNIYLKTTFAKLYRILSNTVKKDNIDKAISYLEIAANVLDNNDITTNEPSLYTLSQVYRELAGLYLKDNYEKDTIAACFSNMRKALYKLFLIGATNPLLSRAIAIDLFNRRQPRLGIALMENALKKSQNGNLNLADSNNSPLLENLYKMYASLQNTEEYDRYWKLFNKTQISDDDELKYEEMLSPPPPHRKNPNHGKLLNMYGIGVYDQIHKCVISKEEKRYPIKESAFIFQNIVNNQAIWFSLFELAYDRFYVDYIEPYFNKEAFLDTIDWEKVIK
jgi:lipopolysaccharide biosynthesis regulator YciM